MGYSKNKGGRPRVPEEKKLKHQVKVNLTEEEYRTLKLQATIGGMSLSQAARHGIHRVRIRQPVSVENISFEKEILELTMQMRFVVQELRIIRNKGLSGPEIDSTIEDCVNNFSESYAESVPMLREIRAILINLYEKS